MQDLGLVKKQRGRHFSQHEAACGAERHFRMPVARGDHSRNVCACWRAAFFFLRRSTHACVARALRPPCTAVVTSVSAWPFQHGASHRCAGFHTLQRISRLNCWKHVPAIAPVVAYTIDGHQNGLRARSRRSWRCMVPRLSRLRAESSWRSSCFGHFDPLAHEARSSIDRDCYDSWIYFSGVRCDSRLDRIMLVLREHGCCHVHITNGDSASDYRCGRDDIFASLDGTYNGYDVIYDGAASGLARNVTDTMIHIMPRRHRPCSHDRLAVDSGIRVRDCGRGSGLRNSSCDSGLLANKG